jgi:hypothetical protein
MESNSDDLTRQRFATFARTVMEMAGQANTLIGIGNPKRAQQIMALLVEEACLHLRRLNGVPDNVDDSGEDAEGNATDYMAHDLGALNREFGNDDGLR